MGWSGWCNVPGETIQRPMSAILRAWRDDKGEGKASKGVARVIKRVEAVIKRRERVSRCGLLKGGSCDNVCHAMDIKRLRELYNRCNPFESLEPRDERNVDIDGFGEDDTTVRGERWIDVLELQVTLTDRPFFGLFTGLTGAGKSTELRKLAERLGDASACNLFTVRIDASDNLDLTVQVDVSDILLMMLHATELAVLAEEREPVESAFRDGPFVRVWEWLARLDGASAAMREFTFPEPASVMGELRTRKDVREDLRRLVATHLQSFRRRVADEFTTLEARVKARRRAGILVIVDSLEKLQGTSQTYYDVLDSAWQIFANGAPYLSLPIHAIHTIPSALLKRAQLQQVVFFPMIKLSDRHGKRYQPGYDAVREVIVRRIPLSQLKEIFGESEVEARIEELIRVSGGYPREVVILLRDLVSEAATGRAVDRNTFHKVIQRHGDTVRRQVPDYAFDWLARVAHERRLILDREDQRPMVETLLGNNVVLRYLDEVEWFDIHPAVREIPAIESAIKRLEGKTAGGSN